MPLFGPNIKGMKENGDIEGLIQELRNKDLRVRIEVIKALAELKHARGLIEALKNDSPEIRAEAISALEGIDEPEGSDALVDALYTEEVEGVWQKAFEAVTKPLQVAVTKSTSAIENAKSILEGIGMELLKSGRSKFALKCFEKAAEISPEKETLGSLGVALIDHGLHEEALKYFKRIIEIDPSDARGWAGKGLVLFNLSQEVPEEQVKYILEEAIICCKKALEIEPKLKGARDTLGAIYYRKGDYEAMTSLVQETLQFTPEDIRARVMLSEALALSSKLIEAESELQKALDLLYKKEYIEPEELSIIHQQLGIIHAMRGHREKAIVELKEAIRANQRDQWSYKLLDAYMILDMMGMAMKGNPLERRSQLLAYATQRARAYSSLAEWEAEWRE